jgi:hypothetical protein
MNLKQNLANDPVLERLKFVAARARLKSDMSSDKA